MLNIYGTGDWATKITSLLNDGEYAQFDESNYDQAPGNLSWVIALENGDDRVAVQNSQLGGSKIEILFKGCNNLNGVTVGEGLFVGCCSLIRPGTVIGDQVYIGAGTIIDINCNIGDGVTIGDNVTIHEGVDIPNNTDIPSGSVVHNV
jgi:acetyltransferase-like isoleucine patch superfamily enzyme